MRMRDKTAGRPWITDVQHGPGHNVEEVLEQVLSGSSGDAEALSHRLRLHLVLECDVDGFALRCYSTAQSEMLGLPHGATCHRGTDLTSVLAAAVYDWCLLKTGKAVSRVSTIEREIWVPF